MAKYFKSLNILFRALGDRNRLRVVVSLLKREELCACQIHEWLGVSGATASNHLNILIKANIVKNRKEGRWVHYSLNREDKGIDALLVWMEQEIARDLELADDLNRLDGITACPPDQLRKKQREKIVSP